MKFKKMIFLLIVALSVSVMAACSPKKVEQKLDTIEDSVEQKLDKAEDKNEDAVKPNGNNQSLSTPKITTEQAQEAALAHAGFLADQVTGLRIEYEIDDGISHYDVKFYRDRLEYDYEINAETGEIMSFEIDD